MFFGKRKKRQQETRNDSHNVVLGTLYTTLRRELLLWRILCGILALPTFVFAIIAICVKHRDTHFTPVFIQELADGTFITREASNIAHFVPRHPTLVRHDVANYVQLRESWHAALFSRQAYLLCGTGSFSTTPVCNAWEASQGNDANTSFLAQYGLTESRTIRIIAVNFIESEGGASHHDVANQNIATVVYEATRKMPDGVATLEGDYKATIAYQYRGAPEDKIRALNNPLGFTVTDYRSEKLYNTALKKGGA